MCENKFEDIGLNNLNSIDMEFKGISEENNSSIENKFTSNTVNTVKKTGYIVDFSTTDDIIPEEDIPIREGELILNEKKDISFINQATIEQDYWEKLKNKHLKTNVKGSYNNNFHLVGNPEKEMNMFNHAMGSDFGEPVSGDIIGLSSPGESMGLGESLDINSILDNKLFKDLLLFNGFEINKNQNNYILVDTLITNEDCTSNNFNEILNYLKSYFFDFICIPLELETKESFTTFKDWVNWFTEEKEKVFPSIKQDIEYCKFLSNLYKEENE